MAAATPRGRSLVASALLPWLVAGVAGVTAAAESSPLRLQDGRQLGELQRVRVTLQVRGAWSADDGVTDQSPQSTIEASGRLTYQERILALPASRTEEGAGAGAARYYERAEATLRAAGAERRVVLPPAQSLILARASEGRLQLSSISEPLSRDELQLLTVPGNSLESSLLLPADEMQLGQTWRLSPAALAAVLNLDEVTVHEVGARLTAVERGLARVQLAGEAAGHVEGAVSSVRISGEYRFDLRWGRISWLQLNLEERRDASPAAPGFKVQAELRMLVEPVREPDPQIMQPLEQVASQFQDLRPSAALRYESEAGRFRLLHEPAWHVVDDRSWGTSLRLVAGDTAVAQCNLRRLAPFDAGKALTLEQFQDEIRQALQTRFGQFEQARRLQRQDGYQLLHVVVLGSVEEIPIKWVYYHLASPAGDRAACVFTMQVNSEEAFAAHDQLLVESLQLESMSASEATPVDQAVSPTARADDHQLPGQPTR